jgi:hypothetical protein
MNHQTSISIPSVLGIQLFLGSIENFSGSRRLDLPHLPSPYKGEESLSAKCVTPSILFLSTIHAVFRSSSSSNLPTRLGEDSLEISATTRGWKSTGWPSQASNEGFVPRWVAQSCKILRRPCPEAGGKAENDVLQNPSLSIIPDIFNRKSIFRFRLSPSSFIPLSCREPE